MPEHHARGFFRGKRALVSEVVIETIFHGWANSDLGGWKELLHRLRHQVGAGVAQHLNAIIVLGRHDGRFAVFVDCVGSVHQGAVDPAGQGCLGKARANGFGDLM